MEARIKLLFPFKMIYDRLSSLNNELLAEDSTDGIASYSFQTSNLSRKFFHLTFTELCYLFEQTIQSERSLYEVIPPSKPVKLYIDFEYYLRFNDQLADQLVGLKCILKILYSIFNFADVLCVSDEQFIQEALKQHLILTAYAFLDLLKNVYHVFLFFQN